ncbi:MAG: response regulator [Alphaproteobacteria bacterium]
MSQPRNIVVIEDDLQLRRFLHTGLEMRGYQVTDAGSAEEGLAAIIGTPPALVLLDLGLPDRDGLELLVEVRRWTTTPVLIISSRNDTSQKIAALDLGADDYVTKPFDMGELLARIRAALRSHETPVVATTVFRTGELEVDQVRYEVRVRGEMVRLSPKEMELLRLFVTHADKVLTSQMILKWLWGETHQQDGHYLRIFISRLRRKLESDPARPRYIVTEPGMGYRLCRLPTGTETPS